MQDLSISKILNSRIAMVVICVNIFISIIFVLFSMKHAKSDFRKGIELHTAHLVDTFTQLLWLFDLNTTEKLVAMALDAPEISGLRILDHEERVVVEKGDVDSSKDNFISKKLVHAGGVVVGHLDLAFTNTSHEKQRNIIFLTSSLVVVLTVLLTYLLISSLLKRHLIRPLHKLQQDMVILADGKFKASTLSGQTSEIQAIIDGFNKMADALSQREEGRRRAEEKSRENQKRYLSLIRDSKDSIFTMMRGGFLVDVNPAMFELLGYTEKELSHINMGSLFEHKDALELLEQEVEEKGSINDYQVRLLDKKSDIVHCLLSASLWKNDEDDILGFQGILRDITAQVSAEEQQNKLQMELRQKYKMEAVGLMAGGIAHNFNNNLAIILGNIELAQLKSPADANIQDHLSNANVAIHRARDLTRQILTYSRHDSHDLVAVQPALIVGETLKLMRSTIPTTVNLRTHISDETTTVSIEGDASRIQEVLINLCNNAVQSMDESGDLTIRMSRVELEQYDIPARFNCASGSYVYLSFEDSGCGMSADVQERIFDPFFTTKSVNQGTGMGLSTVLGIIEQHKGLIKVQSVEGRGTIFHLYFPVLLHIESLNTEESDLGLPKGTERILFVDDDEMLVSVGDSMLTTLGYQVVSESDSKKALELLEQDLSKFDLLITDQTMPGLTGLEITQKLHEMNPHFPVILCTGYSSKAPEKEIKESNISAFCMKPLELSVLANEVRKALDE